MAIINETFARRFWGTADPVGQRIAWGNTASHGPWMRIVGVVGDVKQGALNTETVPHTYTPWLQVSDAMMADNIVAMMRSLRIAVRGEVEPGALAGPRARIRALDPALPVASVQTMKEIVSRSAAVPRFNALLVSLFAALALLLAAIGVGGCWRRRSHAGFPSSAHGWRSVRSGERLCHGDPARDGPRRRRPCRRAAQCMAAVTSAFEPSSRSVHGIR